MANRVDYEEQTLSVAGLSLALRKKGSGSPAVVLHQDVGAHAWLPFHEQLSRSLEVFVPDLPGFGKSDRPEWARHPRDLAILTLQLLDQLKLDRLTLIGLGFGGWVAAEMATMAQERLDSLVLVAPMGIKPQHGDIVDQMMLSHIDYVKAGFHDDAAFESYFPGDIDPELSLFWDLNREMTARVAWKPYMFSHQLPHLLKGVLTPTLVVWGEQDRVVPRECGDLFAQALPNSELALLSDAGHFVELECPEELARLIEKHSHS